MSLDWYIKYQSKYEDYLLNPEKYINKDTVTEYDEHSNLNSQISGIDNINNDIDNQNIEINDQISISDN